jgi:hypothetical protein
MAIYKSDGVDGVLATPNKFIEVYCSTAVTRGDVVVLALDANFATNGLTVARAGATANLSRACGIAMETISAAGFVQIQYAGFNELATAEAGSGGILVNGLVGTAATAGKIEDFTDATAVTGAVAPFAICARAYTAGDDDGAIIIFDKGYFNG